MESSFVVAILLANAAFNLIAWPQFLRRVLRDPRARDADGKPTTFLTVHLVLVSVAVVLAVASATAGFLLLAA